MTRYLTSTNNPFCRFYFLNCETFIKPNNNRETLIPNNNRETLIPNNNRETLIKPINNREINNYYSVLFINVLGLLFGFINVSRLKK